MRVFQSEERRIRSLLTGRSGSTPVTLVSIGVLATMLAIACYGDLAGRRTLGILGLATSVSIGTGMAMRARDSILIIENAYERLDRSLAEAERANDSLTLSNEELFHANAVIRAMHIAYADLLNLADERTEGRLRALIEATGSDLASLLEEQIEGEQHSGRERVGDPRRFIHGVRGQPHE